MLAWRLKRRSITPPQTWQDRGALTTVVLHFTYPHTAMRLFEYWYAVNRNTYRSRRICRKSAFMVGISPGFSAYQLPAPQRRWTPTRVAHHGEKAHLREFSIPLLPAVHGLSTSVVRSGRCCEEAGCLTLSSIRLRAGFPSYRQYSSAGESCGAFNFFLRRAPSSHLSLQAYVEAARDTW